MVELLLGTMHQLEATQLLLLLGIVLARLLFMLKTIAILVLVQQELLLHLKLKLLRYLLLPIQLVLLTYLPTRLLLMPLREQTLALFQM